MIRLLITVCLLSSVLFAYDVNADGSCDLEDFAEIAKEYGTTYTQSDFAQYAKNFAKPNYTDQEFAKIDWSYFADDSNFCQVHFSTLLFFANIFKLDFIEFYDNYLSLRLISELPDHVYVKSHGNASFLVDNENTLLSNFPVNLDLRPLSFEGLGRRGTYAYLDTLHEHLSEESSYTFSVRFPYRFIVPVMSNYVFYPGQGNYPGVDGNALANRTAVLTIAHIYCEGETYRYLFILPMPFKYENLRDNTTGSSTKTVMSINSMPNLRNPTYNGYCGAYYSADPDDIPFDIEEDLSIFFGRLSHYWPTLYTVFYPFPSILYPFESGLVPGVSPALYSFSVQGSGDPDATTYFVGSHAFIDNNIAIPPVYGPGLGTSTYTWNYADAEVTAGRVFGFAESLEEELDLAGNMTTIGFPIMDLMTLFPIDDEYVDIPLSDDTMLFSDISINFQNNGVYDLSSVKLLTRSVLLFFVTLFFLNRVFVVLADIKDSDDESEY